MVTSSSSKSTSTLASNQVGRPKTYTRYLTVKSVVGNDLAWVGPATDSTVQAITIAQRETAARTKLRRPFVLTVVVLGNIRWEFVFISILLVSLLLLDFWLLGFLPRGKSL